MQNAVFKFSDYKSYLCAVETESKRGFRASIAKRLRCQPAYISQVLGGDAQLSCEQAELINTLLGHSKLETDFFLLLVQLARSGSVALRRRIQDRIDAAKKEVLRLKEQFELPSLDRAVQAIYYSSWCYAAVHVAVSIPAFSSPVRIAECLGLPLAQVRSILQFLVGSKILSENQGHYCLNQFRLHLEDDSPFISQHHSHWRMKALESIQKVLLRDDAPKHLHYSSVVTIADEDIDTLRAIILDFLKTMKSKIKDSKEERVYALNLDFFPIDKRTFD